MQSLPEPVDPEVAEEMFDFADKDKVVVLEYACHVYLIIAILSTAFQKIKLNCRTKRLGGRSSR